MISLTDQQSAAVDSIARWRRGSARTFALTGLAGTGKTTVISALLADGLRAEVVAPTGKAAAVLQRKGVADAGTIHSAIYRRIETAQGPRWVLRDLGVEGRPSLAIVDEASMVNETVLTDLLKVYRKVLLVGDPGQLPPVEGRSCLAQAEGFELRDIMRQALDSGIIRTAHALRRGALIHDAIAEGGDDVAARLPAPGEIEEHLGAWPMDEATLITARNRDRVWLNNDVRARVLALRDAIPDPLVVGDRVVALTNTPGGWINGMVADVTEVGEPDYFDGHEFVPFRGLCDNGLSREGIALVSQLDAEKRRDDVERQLWRDVRDIRSRFYQRGWCLTAHKAQGAEWSKVIVYGDGFGSTEERAAWRYTAATRARDRLFWVR